MWIKEIAVFEVLFRKLDVLRRAVKFFVRLDMGQESNVGPLE